MTKWIKPNYQATKESILHNIVWSKEFRSEIFIEVSRIISEVSAGNCVLSLLTQLEYKLDNFENQNKNVGYLQAKYDLDNPDEVEEE